VEAEDEQPQRVTQLCVALRDEIPEDRHGEKVARSVEMVQVTDAGVVTGPVQIPPSHLYARCAWRHASRRCPIGDFAVEGVDRPPPRPAGSAPVQADGN